MIYWRIQDLYDAGICDAGRVDCEEIMAREGVKPTDWVTAVWGLFGGVAGTLWGMGYVKKGCEAEARNALSLFILKTAVRREGAAGPKALYALDCLLKGHKINLAQMREAMRLTSVDERMGHYTRACALLFHVATDTDVPLHIRAVRVSEQSILAANYAGGDEGYKAEYQRQYDQLKGILEGE